MHPPSPGRPPRRFGPRRATALASAVALAAGVVVAAAPTASADPVAVNDATLTWGFNSYVQGPAFFGGCAYFSAGPSDGDEATYATSQGNVTILQGGVEPAYADRCAGADTNSIDQQVVLSNGTGTVDPATGEATLSFTGTWSINYYGGLVPFWFTDPTVTVDAQGNAQVVATMDGFASSIDSVNERTPIDPPVDGVVIADLTGVDVTGTGFSVTPEYAGVEYTPPQGSNGDPQNRTTQGWGSFPASFVDFQFQTGLGGFFYHTGGTADPKKAPTPLSVSYSDVGGSGGSGPGDGEQVITFTVPEVVDPGEFVWSISDDGRVDLGETSDQGTYLIAFGAIDPITVTDTRTDGPEWNVSGQVTEFTGGQTSWWGWQPEVLQAGAGAVAGLTIGPSNAPVGGGGPGLSTPQVLAAAPAGHAGGTASLGATAFVYLPPETTPGSYDATLTLTALS